MFRNGAFSPFLPFLFFIVVLIAPLSLSAAPFALGADVSWLPQMEALGYSFYNDAGVRQDCIQILKDHGINTIRLRVWVNPSNNIYNGHCSKAETVVMAKRAAAMGFRIMIDFHYSDSWADPGQQTKPAAWSSHGISQLITDVYDHTYDVLDSLKSAGIIPEWVQVGNETNDGMLWEDGRASANMGSFASLVTSGCNAVKAVDSSIKVIVHISNGYDNALFRWIFDGLKTNSARYDVIGMSLYPASGNWSTLTGQCLTNMNDMVSRYGKQVMICEVGMAYTAAQACKDMLTDLISKTKSVSGNSGLGVFYWEPECYNWNGYNLGAWNTNGRPTIALDAFLTGTLVSHPLSGSLQTPGFLRIAADPVASALTIYYRVQSAGHVSLSIVDIQGKKTATIMRKSLQPGTYTTTWKTGGFAAGRYYCSMQSTGGRSYEAFCIK